MDIRDIIGIIIKRWILILSLTLLFGISSMMISIFLLQNVYESSAVMIISSPTDNQQQGQLTLSDYTLNVQLVNSYRVLCKTDKVLNQVIDETKLPLNAEQLSAKITVTSENDTDIIRISAQDESPETAARIANAVATIFVREIPQIMRMDNVQVIDNAVIPKNPVKPNRQAIIAVAALLGMMLGIGISFLIDYLDVSIKSAEQLGELLGVPVLGSIPHMQERDR
jgi:capsular polysaccharide biosynthesis protein